MERLADSNSIPQLFDRRPLQSAVTVAQKLSRNVGVLSRFLVGRDDILKQSLYALLTRQHQLMLGRTGVAKSLLADNLFRPFSQAGSSLFKIKASVEDTKDNYFGPVDIPLYRNEGRKVRTTGRSILAADFAFIDEIFDANEQILRDLLLLLGDRQLVEGEMQYESPLRSVIAACNYLRVNEVTEAVLDRFAFKAVVPDTPDSFDQFLIDNTYSSVSRRQAPDVLPISLQELDLVHAAIRGSGRATVNIPPHIIYLKNIIVRLFCDRMRRTKDDYYISPRRQAQLTDVIKASALLAGRTEAVVEDLHELRYMLITINMDPAEEQNLADVTAETLRFFGADEKFRTSLTTLARIAQLLAGMRDDPTLIHRVSCEGMFPAPPSRSSFFRQSRGSDCLATLKEVVEGIQPSYVYVTELREGCLREIRRLNELRDQYAPAT